MRISKRLLAGTALTVLTGLAATQANAQAARQQTGLTGLEEIVVTAQRREQNLQQVPIAVSAFSEAELTRRQISRTIDIIQFIPNMEGHNNTGIGTANTYSIRGLNNTESIATFDPPVGTYVDEIFIARQNSNNFSFFDVERLEVLRGPQGTLFGRNTTGGAITVTMKKPAEKFGGFLEVGYGKYNRVQVRGSVDVPLIEDKLLTKTSAFHIRDDGYVFNRTLQQHMNFEHAYGLREGVQLRFSDTVRWDASGDYINDNYANLLNKLDPVTGQRYSLTGIGTSRGIGAFIVGTTKQNQTAGSRTRVLGLTSNLTVEAGNATINVITGYRRMRHNYMTDALDQPTIYGGFPSPFDGTFRQFTQEVKVTGKAMDGKIDYVVGAFYFHDKNDSDMSSVLFPAAAPTTPLVQYDRILRNTTTAGAGYAQADFHATEELKITAGIRYTDESKDIAMDPNPNPFWAPAATPNAAGLFSTQTIRQAGIPTDRQVKIWTPRFAVNYQVTPDAMLFASATRGFKSGGWNARSTSAVLTQPFDPEKVWSYETGIRSDWFDKRLRVNATAFLMDTKAFQLPAAFVTPTGAISFITGNYSDYRDYGAEFEISAVPVDNLDVYATLGLQHARYRNVSPGVATQASNCQAAIRNGTSRANLCDVGIVTADGNIALPVRAPSWNSTVGFSYTLPIASLEATFSGSWNHVNRHPIGTSNPLPSFTPTRDLFNAGVRIKSPDMGWSLGFDCTNCTNKTYVVSYLPPNPYYNEPGRWMFTARYDF
jgi:iron complex outermembrane receptor protein